MKPETLMPQASITYYYEGSTCLIAGFSKVISVPCPLTVTTTVVSSTALTVPLIPPIVVIFVQLLHDLSFHDALWHVFVVV